MPNTPSLLESQQAMLQAIRVGDSRALQDVVVSDDIAAADRVAIHRNTAVNTLVKALRLSHPAVHRLVGADFFEASSQIFLEGVWPRNALLDEFGSEFAAFLDGFEPAAGVPYLGDVARLEWTVHRALHAADAPRLDIGRLAGLVPAQGGQLCLCAHPSLGLLSVDWPVDAIWRAVIEEDDAALAGLDPLPGRQWLLVQRSDTAGAEVLRLEESQWRFVQCLCLGTCLQEAIDLARRNSAGMAIDELLGQLLAAGRFTDFSVGREFER